MLRVLFELTFDVLSAPSASQIANEPSNFKLMSYSKVIWGDSIVESIISSGGHYLEHNLILELFRWILRFVNCGSV